MTSPIGAHVSIVGGYREAFKRAHDIGATAIQFFTKSPRSGVLRQVTPAESTEVLWYEERKNLSFGVIHASYLLNFAQVMEPSHYQFKSLAEDLENAEMLGLNGVVVHLGKTLGGDTKRAITNYVGNISKLLNKTKTEKAKIILENTAGQGSELGYKIEEWGKICKRIQENVNEPSRVGVCFDTAHAFAAGYDLSKKETVDQTLKLFDTHIGFENLECVHLNDSKKPLGSRVDRHEDIGRGTIGKEGLAYFAHKISKKRIPLILETPETFSPFAEQIMTAREWLKS